MYKVLSATPIEPTDGHVDLDFRDTDAWGPLEENGKIMPIMLGDEHAGPFVVLSCFPPMDEQMPLSFAHAHASDNWRISIRGTTNMGKDSYAEGQFRFHDGGVPYASDNFAWGPDGGFGIIMFADRRGFAIRPVKASIAEKVVPEQEAGGEALGIDMMDPCPGAPAINTTLGRTERAHLDGGFESADSWPELAPGVRFAAGLAGEPECGPVLVFIDADPGAEALPSRTLETEVLAAVVRGSVRADGDELDAARVRLEEAETESPPLVAGDDGVQLVAIVADRRALASALATGTLELPALRDALAELQQDLQPAS
ncbi:MAG: hypothetical protein U5K30_13385 [Acidimicrobiales bacterium]|nr:hypothetical protein [Acidimicrobiales bacterium]